MNTQENSGSGLTCVIDDGLPTGLFVDYITSHRELISCVKFGWGTALVTKDIERKVATLNECGVGYFFGGTLFEHFYSRKELGDFRALLDRHRCPIVEISDGTIDLPRYERIQNIRQFSQDFEVWTEIGYKDQQRSLDLPPSKWIEGMKEALDAGSSRVITEARESGTSGICRPNGEVRFGLIEEILQSPLEIEKILFEAPNKHLQVYFIRKVGAAVNLANISFSDIVPLSTLRKGLQADTFDLFSPTSV
jgi:phosphosulfolactate synthase